MSSETGRLVILEAFVALLKCEVPAGVEKWVVNLLP
jgi:hypothetical protein